ncbi:MAG: twin-arginine translocation signal domain-containing protein [Anaerolineales bacterium]|nr:twin-arginine translocation signal domain-containing protein [Anaerolineales bacterium]
MSTKRMSRRDFLRVSGMSVAGLALVACAAPVAPGASSGAESAPSDGVTEIRLGTWGDTTDKTV